MMFSNIIDYPQESLFPNVQQINPFRTPNFPHQMGSSLSSSFLTQQPLNYEVTPSYFPNYPSVLYEPICNQELEALPSAKKDRHTKISTAQGVRVRRVRLSMGIAREFFDLQDLLGFDKASKTLAWLLAKSKGAIHELALEKEGVGLEGKEDLFGSSSSGAPIRKRRRKRKRVGSDFGREQLCSKRAITNAICKVEGIEKGSDGISQGGCCYNSLVVREKRARARARARARTREKLSAMTEPVQFDHHGLLGNHESGYYGSKLDVDSKAQGFNDCKFVDSDGVINGVKGHDLSCLGYSQYDPIAPISDHGFVRVNHLPNSAGHEDTFSSYWGWNICDLHGVNEPSLY